MASSVGNQTGAIYARDLKTGQAKFRTYLYKEFILGIIFGIVFSLFSGGIIFFWFKDLPLTLSIIIASFLTITSAPILSLLITNIFQFFHKDPAVGSAPITTVLQDIISVIIYGIVTSIIML